MPEQSFAAAIPTPRLIAGMSRNTRAKWLFLAALGALDVVWMKTAGFRAGEGFLPCAAAAAGLAAIALFYFYSERDERIRDFAHFGAQFLVLSLVMIPLEYLAVSTNAPLADRGFVALDEAMGLDWPLWAQWVGAHPPVHSILFVVYASIWAQLIVAFVYNVHTRAARRNSELWWVITISSLVTIAVASVWPATSAWVYDGLAPMNDFAHMQQFAALRSGGMRSFDLGNTQGLIQLPSFHTVLAIVLAYNFRHHRLLLVAAVLLFTDGSKTAALTPLILPVALVINYPHFSATLYRLYQNPANLHEFPVTAIALPLLLLGAVIAGLYQPELIAPYIIMLYLLWSPYHYSGQTIGLTMVYARRAGFAIGRRERLALSSLVFSAFVCGAVLLQAAAAHNGLIDLNGLQVPAFTFPPWLYWGAQAVMAAGALSFCYLAALWCWRERRLLPRSCCCQR